MNFLTESNGRQPQDATGNQGWQEAEREDSLQLETCAADGIFKGKTRQYIVHIENASDFRAAFVVKEVKTAAQLFQVICEKHPKLCHDNILMRVSDARMGTIHRVFYEQALPVHTESLYVQLALRKHGPLYGSKIEKD